MFLNLFLESINILKVDVAVYFIFVLKIPIFNVLFNLDLFYSLLTSS